MKSFNMVILEKEDFSSPNKTVYYWAYNSYRTVKRITEAYVICLCSKPSTIRTTKNPFYSPIRRPSDYILACCSVACLGNSNIHGEIWTLGSWQTQQHRGCPLYRRSSCLLSTCQYISMICIHFIHRWTIIIHYPVLINISLINMNTQSIM